MKSLLRKILLRIPLDINRNITYDREAREIIKRVTNEKSNCVDVGCHKGEFMDLFLKYCPEGTHLGFEPLPHLFEKLQNNYGGGVTISNICLSDTNGESTFKFVKSNPAYSGLLERKYDRASEEVVEIKVETRKLDEVIKKDQRVDFIKIDVEGAEYKVLCGARATILKHRPVIVFEFGLGAADVYGVRPEMMYKLFVRDLGMKVGLMGEFLRSRKSMSSSEFNTQFTGGLNYYFVAWYEDKLGEYSF